MPQDTETAGPMDRALAANGTGRGRALARLVFCFDLFGVALFLMLMTTTLLGVVARYMLLPGFEWTFELAGLTFVWIVFIGTVSAELRRENVAFEAVVQRFGSSGRRGFAILSALVLLTVGVVMTWSAFGVIERTLHVLTPVLRLPSAIAVISVQVFAISAVLIAISRLVSLTIGKAPEAQS